MTFQSKSALIAAAALTVAAGANAAVSFNGDANVELDTTNTSAKTIAGASNNSFTQGGRVEVNIAGKSTNGDSFVAGRGTLTLQKGGATGTDDMWVQFGNSKADVKLGRFEAADLYPAGRDTVVNRAGSGNYATNTLRGRTNEAHAALTLNLGGGSSVEVGIIETKTTAAKGVRPVVSFGAGPASVKLGFESGKSGGNSFSGMGGTVGLKAGPGALNVNFASGKTKVTTGDVKRSAFAANYTVDMGVWVFVESAKNTTGAAPSEKISTFGLGYQLPLLGVNGASITPALSNSSATNGASGNKSDTSLRVRVNYSFAAF
ncbi:MAG: hypothetical protein RIQ60_3695 [Pseudomonadota bacterium]|jgi:hypothetical protein